MDLSKELGIIVKVSDFLSPVATDNGILYRTSIIQDWIYDYNGILLPYQQLDNVFLEKLHSMNDYGWDKLFNILK